MNLFVALPNYRRDCYDMGHEKVIDSLKCNQKVHTIKTAYCVSSLLAHGFNKMWCEMLNERSTMKWDHWLMIHGDVCPVDRNWFDILHGELERFKLEALGCSIALRGSRNKECSTAIDGPSPGNTRRMLCSELQDKTITSRESKGLLINTGLLLVKCTGSWCEDFSFNIYDGIRKLPDGKFEAVNSPEDWNMSRFFTAKGIPYGATGKVTIDHLGIEAFRNRA